MLQTDRTKAAIGKPDGGGVAKRYANQAALVLNPASHPQYPPG